MCCQLFYASLSVSYNWKIIIKKKDQRKVDITSDDPSNLPIQIRNRQFSSPFSKTQLMESVSCDSVLAGGNLFFFWGGGRTFPHTPRVRGSSTTN